MRPAVLIYPFSPIDPRGSEFFTPTECSRLRKSLEEYEKQRFSEHETIVRAAHDLDDHRC
jgi:hypothetical protein